MHPFNYAVQQPLWGARTLAGQFAQRDYPQKVLFIRLASEQIFLLTWR